MVRLAFAAALIFLMLGGAGAAPDTKVTDPAAGDWVREADVLYIGDSESLGYFGDNIYRWASDMKHPRSGRKLSVWSFWSCGSDVMSWMVGARTVCGIRTCNGGGQCARDHGPHDGPAKVAYGPLKRYLASVRPHVTIISLGTNFLTTSEFHSKAFYSFYLDRVGAMVGQVRDAGSRCIWIGPPQASLHTKSLDEYAAFVADMRRTVEAGGCAFIDSGPLSDRKYVLTRDPEGTHYQGDGEKAWSSSVWRLLAPALEKALSAVP